MKLGGGRKQKKRVNADTYFFVSLVFISFALLFFSNLSFVLNIKDEGLSMFSGIRGGVSGAAAQISRIVLSVQELSLLQREYTELSERIRRYEQLERSAAEIRQENHRLRQQLGFSEQVRYRHIPAQIIGRDPDNLFSSFVINKGKRDGVTYNMAILAFQDGMQALVGKVVQAGYMESLIMPVYDVSSFVPARFAASRYDGLVEGQGKSEYPLLMRLINKRAREEINTGDMVVTSGIGGGADGGAVYPGEINIGRVSRILYKEDESSMEVELDTAIDFSRLEYVFVIEAAFVESEPAEVSDNRELSDG
jgi:rod shape-determining protein MreC